MPTVDRQTVIFAYPALTLNRAIAVNQYQSTAVHA